MTSDHALQLVSTFTQQTLIATGPLLAVAAVVGTLVGVMQTATQIQEPSIAYAFKVAAMTALLLVAGPAIAQKVVGYTHDCFDGIAHVVH